MNRPFVEHLAEHPLIAILRGVSPHALAATIDTLAEAGVETLEVTLPTPGAAQAISEARERHPNLVIGAGTVTTAQQVDAALAAGAMFLVSPNTDPAVLARAAKVELPSLPGAFSPSEILLAWRLGAAGVKVFPARSLGPRYITDVHAPLPEIPLVAVGGVGLADVRPYLDAGALAVGVGSPLLGDALEGGSQHELLKRARLFVDAQCPTGDSGHGASGPRAIREPEIQAAVRR
jgi:2-dehydro-3-deoxyphosphogluconate aldolase/(4S)-4-hydroxy-2-oxoglutarate aldolase